MILTRHSESVKFCKFWKLHAVFSCMLKICEDSPGAQVVVGLDLI